VVPSPSGGDLLAGDGFGIVPTGTPTVSAAGAATSTAVTEVAEGGLVTWLPAAGATVANGDVLYRVDNAPVVLLEGDATLYRDLGEGDEGADVLALETALAALGYSVDVDEEFEADTTAELEEFQESVALEVTGELDLTTVVMHDGPVVVSTLVLAVGDEVSAGDEVVVVSDAARDVTFALDPAQLTSLAPGDTLAVSLPQGGTADAEVTSVAAAPSEDGTYAVTARLASDAEVAGDRWEVDVRLEREVVGDALLVDPSAIVMLEGGRTVVRVIRDGEPVDVPVTVIATSGRVTAIESEALAEGDQVSG
jgi:hypothetical protein